MALRSLILKNYLLFDHQIPADSIRLQNSCVMRKFALDHGILNYTLEKGSVIR